MKFKTDRHWGTILRRVLKYLKKRYYKNKIRLKNFKKAKHIASIAFGVTEIFKLR